MKLRIVCTLLGMIVTSNAVAQNPIESVFSSTRFEQVALTVTDLETASNFYKNQLGLDLMFEANGMLFFDVGGTRLMIALDAQRVRPKRPNSIFYFHVSDFTAALHRLRATEANLIGPVETVRSSEAGALRLQQFEDPEGNMLAIMGFVPA